MAIPIIKGIIGLTTFILYVFGYIYAAELGPRTFNPSYLKRFKYYFVVTFITTALPQFHADLVEPSMVMYTFFELIFFTYLFSEELYQHRFLKGMMGMAGGIIGLCVLDWIVVGDLRHDNLYILADLLVLTTLSGLYFKKLYQGQPDKNLLKEPFFWIASGGLIFFAGTIPLYFYEHLRRVKIVPEEPEAFRPIVHEINSVLYIVMLLFFIRSFTCRKPVAYK